MYDAIDEAIVLDERERASDQQGGNPMHTCPQSLRYFICVLAVELPGVDAALNTVAKEIKAAFGACMDGVLALDLLGLHNRHNIVIWIVDVNAG